MANVGRCIYHPVHRGTLAGHPGLAGLDMGYGAIYRTYWTRLDFNPANRSLSNEAGRG